MEDNLLLALIASGSALAGSLIGQLGSVLMHRLERQHRRAVLLREKYEELAHGTNDVMSWSQDVQAAKSLETLRSKSQPLAARRGLALALIYFPKLKGESVELLNSAVGFHFSLCRTYTEALPLTAGAQAAANNSTEYMLAAKRLQAARQAMDEGIQKHAGTYARE